MSTLDGDHARPSEPDPPDASRPCRESLLPYGVVVIAVLIGVGAMVKYAGGPSSTASAPRYSQDCRSPDSSLPPNPNASKDHSLATSALVALGENFGGAWFDNSGWVHVGVANGATPTPIEGVIFEHVDRSSAELDAVRSRIDTVERSAHHDGFAIGGASPDEMCNRLIVGAAGDVDKAAGYIHATYGQWIEVVTALKISSGP